METNNSIDTKAGSLETPEVGSSPFTQANLVGLFLTLMLCLLTQPWGSLVYPPPKDSRSRTVRAVFFIWRISPLACAIEAASILTCLLDTAIHLIQHCRHPDRGAPGVKQLLSTCAHEFHVTAAALLLLRANGDSDGPIELLLSEPLRYPNRPHVPPVAITLTNPSGEVAILPTFGTRSSAGRYLGQSTSRSDNTLLPHVLGTGGYELPAARPTAPSSIGAMDGIKAALRTTAFAYKEKWVDVMAVSSVLVTTTKLIAITGMPWHLRAAVALFLCDWFAVQLLLWLFHLRDLDTNNIALSASILSRARRQRALLWSSRYYVRVLVRLAMLPPIIYLGLVIGRTLFFSQQTDDDLSMSLGIAYLPGMGPASSPPPIFSGGITVASVAKLAVHLPMYLLVITVVYTIGLVPWATLLVLMVLGGHTAYKSGRRRLVWVFWISALVAVIAYQLFFNYYMQVDQSRYVFMLRMVLAVGAASLLYWFSLDAYRGNTGASTPKRDDKDGLPLLLVNAVMWVYIFEYAVGYYDAAGTYKPEWLEYLG
ncbi:hypothetical protein B0H66DRAFT_529941 [Apodospora peruviana]|uniref:Uncharacterized protein n=1 Tax=Apodospora peruviana TaxID=516989 RepID=A0AAE0IIY4_9PEZI|nr:hypothetical protein B0H66DRAFT_529941 [Apodospora peruviana]